MEDLKINRGKYVSVPVAHGGSRRVRSRPILKRLGEVQTSPKHEEVRRSVIKLSAGDQPETTLF